MEFAEPFGLNPTTGTSANPLTDISELSGFGKFTYTRTAEIVDRR